MKKSMKDNHRDYAIICEDDVYLKTMDNFHEIIFYYLMDRIKYSKISSDTTESPMGSPKKKD